MSDIVNSAISSVNQVKSSNIATSDDPIIWVRNQSSYFGGTPTRAQGYSSADKKQFQTLSQMQNRVLAWGGARSPQYDQYVNKLVAGGFMSESYRDQPVTASNALAYAVKVYEGYSSNGGELSFDDWFDWYASTGTGSAGGGAGGGGYSGPRSTFTMANERDLRAAADAIGAEVLGRAITDDEFERALKKVRKAERSEPTVTTSTAATTVSQAGLSAEGRQDILRTALMKGPEAREFAQATKMMDLFYSALNARPEGA